ncbi:MAG: tetratricopeptide repeat protein [Opitutaceae bacterium]
MMLNRFPLKKSLCVALALTVGSLTTYSQDEGGASQLSFSNLQIQANLLVEKGDLIQAMPLLKELITRVEGMADTGAENVKLDFPIFLVGTGYIQMYLQSGENSDLEQSLTWYDKLEKDFPRSPKVKDAALKRIDVLRALGETDDATQLMVKILSGGYSFKLSYKENIKILSDLVQTFYGTGKLKEGLPYYKQLIETSRDPEDKALAAAASFEAYASEKNFDDAMKLVPFLALESEARYAPRLNVALLKTSDAVVEVGRINDAAILLNLIKTTDIIIDYYEGKLAKENSKLEQRVAFGASEEVVKKIEAEIKKIETNLESLRKLPTLRNELLVRRARNYTQTGRRFEAFWMFNDLMVENPSDERTEFYMYASFANARQIGKKQTVIELGRAYRQAFPTGDYYSDVTAVLADELKELGLFQEFSEVVVDFLNTHPIDQASANLLAQWGTYKFGEEAFAEVVGQTTSWLSMHETTSFDDGLHYWKGLGELQLSLFPEAVQSFDHVLTDFPTSIYAEDALLRKGAAQFYAQTFEEARETLKLYVQKYPEGKGLDQAYFFLGDIEFLAENYQVSLTYFQKADAITETQDIHDSVAFKIGAIFEELSDYDQMATHFESYIEKYGETGRLTDAIFELGRAYEYNLEVTKMLTLYRSTIEQYINSPTNKGVDTLIEGYAEKYVTNEKMLVRTIKFLNDLENDKEYRTKIVTDRGFLFEEFYTNPDLEQTLYNKLRGHQNFNEKLLEDLSPIKDLTDVYRQEGARFPATSPKDFYRELLAKHKGSNQIAEARALMGLYRLGEELAPQQQFSEALLGQATPRLVLYIADYERQKRRDFAIKAWNQVLAAYPQDDAAIVAYMRLADVTAESGDKSGALNYLQAIITQFSGSPQAPAIILRQGKLLVSMDRADEARQKYQYILKVPDWRGILHAKALLQTGESFMEEQKYPEAHGFFERTFLGYSQFNEVCAEAYLKDAEALIGMGDRVSAKATLQEAVDLLSDVAPEELMVSIKAKLQELL